MPHSADLEREEGELGGGASSLLFGGTRETENYFTAFPPTPVFTSPLLDFFFFPILGA